MVTMAKNANTAIEQDVNSIGSELDSIAEFTEALGSAYGLAQKSCR